MKYTLVFPFSTSERSANSEPLSAVIVLNTELYCSEKYAGIFCIIVDTGDENYDYVSNDMYPHYNASSNDVIAEEASILWLIRQQGYKKHQLNKALRYEDYSGSKLLKSIRTEVANCSTVFYLQL